MIYIIYYELIIPKLTLVSFITCSYQSCQLLEIAKYYRMGIYRLASMLPFTFFFLTVNHFLLLQEFSLPISDGMLNILADINILRQYEIK